VPIPSEVGAAFRVRAPEVYERGAVHVTRLEARLAGELVAPASATFVLRSPTGASVSSGSATITASVATFEVPAASLPATLAYGPGYVEEWDVTLSTGRVYKPRRDAYLARRALHCPVTQTDLLGSNPELQRALGSAADSFDGWIDEVWADTLIKLRGSGTWPEQIVEISSLAPYVRFAALTAVYRNLSISNERYARAHDEHKRLAADAWRDVRFSVDHDEDGTPDNAALLRGAEGVIVRSSAPPMRHRRLGRVLG